MTSQTQGTVDAPLPPTPAREEKLKAVIQHMAQGIINGVADADADADAVAVAGTAAVAAAVTVTVTVAAAVTVAAIFAIVVADIADPKRKYTDKISKPAQKTWRRLGVAFLTATSLMTGAAVGKLVYNGTSAEEAKKQKAEAAELAAPRGEYTLNCPTFSLTEKSAAAFNKHLENVRPISSQGCTLSPLKP